jgi:crotonobetainyl-CoA:carnitine CoA-transferase CaiB-like acyl-CoA transferase
MLDLECASNVKEHGGEPDWQPSRAGISIGDSLAATYACVGALAALHHRDRTGEGQVIDASIYESVLSVMEATIPEYTVSNHIRERSGSTLPNVAPSNIYDCSDGIFLIAANQDTVFARLCDAIGQPELASDERFSSHTARGKNMELLDGIINDWTRTLPVDEVASIMEKHRVKFVGRVSKYSARTMKKFTGNCWVSMNNNSKNYEKNQSFDRGNLDKGIV